MHGDSLRTGIVLISLALVVSACGSDESSSPNQGAPQDDAAVSDGDAAEPDADAASQDASTGDTSPDVQPDVLDAGTDVAADAAVDGESDAGADSDANQEAAAPESLVLTFSIDDSANQTYTDSDGLAWKGSFSYDSSTNFVTFNAAWGGPFVPVWDDGPLSEGGHEAEGAVAGDHVWTTQVNILRPDSTLQIEYGAIRGSVSGSDGEWIWNGSNGSITLEPTMAAGTVVEAAGLVIPAFGTVNVRITLDTSALSPAFETPSQVKIKSNLVGWNEVELLDDGVAESDTAADGIYVFNLAEHLGAHDGLAHENDNVQFVFVLDGVEYKESGAAALDGVEALTDAETQGTYVTEVLGINGGGNADFTVGPTQ